MPHVLQWTSDSTALQRLICNDLLSLLHFLCASHPLYFAYFIFFSPYLLHLFFYLSPLLLSTSLLLLLTLLIFSSSPLPDLPCTSLEAILELLKWKIESHKIDTVLAEQIFTTILDSPVYCNMSTTLEKSKEEDKIFVKNNSDVEVISADGENLSVNGTENVRENLRNDLQRDGSMRREREWKRTLACKLYEERMTYKLCEERKVDEGCQEMDMLWEAYEVDALKFNKNGKNIKKEEKNRLLELEEHEEEPCCLQALRLSSGKMNLGVGRPNLMKISKALTGIGILQRISSRRIRKW